MTEWRYLKIFMNMKKYILLFLIVMQISCNKKEVKVENEKLSQKISIDTFSTYPTEIDGCNCGFSEINSKQDIFITNIDSIAYLTINGKLTRFKLSNIDTLKNKMIIQNFKNDDFDLQVESKDSIPTGYETWLNSGKLKLKSKDNQIIEKKFTGECGC